MLFDENRLGNNRTDATRTQESGERSDDMNEKDNEIARPTILTGMAKLQELGGASNSP